MAKLGSGYTVPQHVRNGYSGAKLDTTRKVVMHRQNGVYILNATYQDIWDDEAVNRLNVWKIRIQDEMDNEVCNARICATHADAAKAAEAWLMRMLRSNPGSLLKWCITEHIEQS